MKSTRLIQTLVLCLAASLFCSSSQKKQNEPDKKTYLRGIYLPVRKGAGDARNLDFVKSIVARSKPLGVNAYVLDVQAFQGNKNKVNPEVVAYLKSEQIYVIARIVCFEGGIQKFPVPQAHLDGLAALVEAAAGQGFDEVQLDYIRFADSGVRVALKRKYEFLDKFIGGMREITKRHGVKLSADIFGRIVYNKNDAIGQNLENYAKHTDVIYPMLYPSHFTADKKRLSDPAFTLTEGTQKALDRLQGTSTEIMPWVQCFVYNIQHARVNLTQYVVLQVQAIEKTAARGWVAWNAKGDYKELFQALENIDAPNPGPSPGRP
jgi:hypothetical protein